MEDNLTPILEKILEKYKNFKISEKFYLLYQPESDCSKVFHSLLPIKHTKLPIPLPYVTSRASTTIFIKSHSNIVAKEQDTLTFLPYDEFNKRVYFSEELLSYFTVTPFNQIDLQYEFLQNTQFIEYVALNLLKHYPLNADWIQISQFLAENTSKNKRTMLRLFNSTIKKHFFNSEEQLKKQEFRENFCQICLKYACLLHFYDEESVNHDSDTEKRSEKTYMEDAVSILDPSLWKIKWWGREKSLLKSGKWLLQYQCSDPNHCSKTSASIDLKISKVHKQVISKCLKLGINNPCFISLISNLTCVKIRPFIFKFEHKYMAPEKLPKLPKKIVYTSNTETKLVFQNVIETHCDCKNECSVKNRCPCLFGEVFNGSVISRKCCEKYCRCALTCNKRLLGCNCQFGKCDSKTCICYVNLRECDPEVCIFCVCYTSALEKPLELLKKRKKGNFLCRNVRNLIGMHKRTAMGESAIKGAGIGLFVMEPCEVNDYIIEYSGELISENECQRRAATYDFKHHSFIFSLSPEARWSIDSTYIGSKMRYVNHKSHGEHNAHSQVWLSNGSLKILLFASQKINAFSELFFDYGYDSKQIKYDWLLEYEKKFKKKSKVN